MTAEIDGIVYCRNCGTLKVYNVLPPARCGACGQHDFQPLEATTRGDGSVVFYIEIGKKVRGSSEP